MRGGRAAIKTENDIKHNLVKYVIAHVYSITVMKKR